MVETFSVIEITKPGVGSPSECDEKDCHKPPRWEFHFPSGKWESYCHVCAGRLLFGFTENQ